MVFYIDFNFKKDKVSYKCTLVYTRYYYLMKLFWKVETWSNSHIVYNAIFTTFKNFYTSFVWQML